jgi:hypothetical protein
MGQYEEGQMYLARALAVDPGSAWANHFGPIGPLYSKRPDAALEKVRAAASVVVDDPILHSFEAMIWALRGENRKAQKEVQRALKGKSLLHTHHTWHHVAAAYAIIGKPAESTALLVKASRFGLPNYPAFRDDPFLTSLHNYPPFLRLMAELKREWSAYQREFGRS